jgi:hypothetical protein
MRFWSKNPALFSDRISSKTFGEILQPQAEPCDYLVSFISSIKDLNYLQFL